MLLIREKVFAFVFIILSIQSCQNSSLKDVEIPLEDPLPSWNETAAKATILNFVAAVTTEGSPEFVPQSDRIAVFDNDGTLWSEKPFYFQLYYALDKVKEMAADHPEWEKEQPFKAVLGGDLEALAESGEHGLIQLVMATHTGMTTDEFEASAKKWLRTASHPTKGMPYTKLVYQPMLELLQYLRTNGFTTYIVSGGGIEFLRCFSEELYGVMPEQVVGSSIKTVFEMREDGPVLVRMPEIDFIDDKAGKPVGIHKYIGKRPIAAFGNSDGDLQMLQWTASNSYKNLEVYIHHTDEVREWAYDRESSVGRLDKGLVEAAENNWVVVNMKADWNKVYGE